LRFFSSKGARFVCYLKGTGRDRERNREREREARDPKGNKGSKGKQGIQRKPKGNMIIMEGLMLVPPERQILIGRALWKVSILFYAAVPVN